MRWCQFQKLALPLLGAAFALAPVTALAGTITLTLSPSQGLATASFVARATVSFSCTQLPPRSTATFVFYWDVSLPANQFASVTSGPCDPKLNRFSVTAPAYRPKSPGNRVGVHTVVVSAYAGPAVPLGSGFAAYIIIPLRSPSPSPRATPTHRPSPSPHPSPSPLPAPTCTTEGPPHGCVPVNCAHLTAAVIPTIPGSGPLLLVVLAIPGGLALVRSRRIRRLGVFAMLTLVVSCTATQATATVSPKPAASTHRIAGMEGTPSCRGYWLAGSDGAIFPSGDADQFSFAGVVHMNQPIVGMESTPDGAGYWLVASDGRIFPFGDAGGYGSISNIQLLQPIVAMEDTADGHGYWLIAADGGLFPFGDAPSYGAPVHV
jgi:hypothetical protein